MLSERTGLPQGSDTKLHHGLYGGRGHKDGQHYEILPRKAGLRKADLTEYGREKQSIEGCFFFALKLLEEASE